MADERLLAEVGAVVERYCEAIHTQDEAAFLCIWSGEATDTLISQSTLFAGAGELAGFLGKLGEAYESITLVNDGLDAHLLTDDVAIVVFRYHTECVRRGTGEPYGIAGLETQVMRCVGGAWRIAHVQYHGKAVSA